MKSAGMRYVLTAIFLFGLSSVYCRTQPSVLYYSPPGKSREVYKKNPDVHITVYPNRFLRSEGSVIFIHGGGWQLGGSDIEVYSDWEKPLARAGLNAFSVEHRTAPDYRGNDIVGDCMDAVRYINKNAARFGIPENRFALVGFSSGGHLALMTALRFNSDEKETIKISSVVSYYAASDLKKMYFNGDARRKKIISEFLPSSSRESDESLDQALKEFSPYYNITDKIPYVYLIHGKSDYIIPYYQSQQLHDKITAVQPSKSRLMLLKNSDHNFDKEKRRDLPDMPKKAVKFIKKRM